MKKQLIFLIVGMILVVIGALLKIMHIEFSQCVLLFGLAIEAVALASLVVQSLKKVK